MKNNYKYIGKDYAIHDAKEKVTGRLRYVGDMRLPGMLYGKFLWSPLPHCQIESINCCRAEKIPGVVKIYTYLNTPQKAYNSARTLPEQKDHSDNERMFSRKIRSTGDRVALVVAESMEIAESACELIEVEYQEMPYALTPEEALMPGASPLHGSSNLLEVYGYEVGNNDTLPEDAVSHTSYVKTPKVHHAAMENHVCLADWQADGQIIIYAPCHGVYGVRTVVADALGLKYSQVRVVKTPVGGSFASKQSVVLELFAAWCAYDLHRPVMIQYKRNESIVSSFVRPQTETKITSTIDKKGKLLSCLIDTTLDAGGYATNSAQYIKAIGSRIFRNYRVEHVKYDSRSVYTNTLTAGGARGWGSPEFFTAFEIHLDQVAKKAGLDPLTIRLVNAVQPYEVGKRRDISVGNARVIDCLEKGALAFNWQERCSRPASPGRFRRGVGLACGAHMNGRYGAMPDYASVYMRLNEDGTFLLNTGAHDIGCGTVRTLQLIAGEVLQASLDQISVLEADTERGPMDFGTYSSRTTYNTGACVKKAAEMMKDKLLFLASLILDRPAQYLALENGCVAEKDGNAKINYRELALESILKHNQDLSVLATHYAEDNPNSHGVHFAEVEADTLTGLVRVIDYLAVHDVGQAVNRQMVEGQIQGGVNMSIGYALCEEVRVDNKGMVITDNFDKYHLINSVDMPYVKTLLVEEGGNGGPFQAKSVGEIAAVPGAAAVVNAINHALDTEIADLPVTPEKILAALEKN